MISNINNRFWHAFVNGIVTTASKYCVLVAFSVSFGPSLGVHFGTVRYWRKPKFSVRFNITEIKQ